MNKTYRYLTYKKKDGTCIDIRVSNEDNNECWLTVDEIASLFNKNRTTITRQIKTIYESNNDDFLDSKIEITTIDDPFWKTAQFDSPEFRANLHIITPNSSQKVRIIQENHDKKLRRPPTIYNSKIIIEIGYRIRSDEGIKLKEFLDSQNAIIPIKDEEIIVYNNNGVNIDVRFSKNENTVWLNQEMIAKLFDTTQENVSMHIKNIFLDGEIDKNSVYKDFLYTAQDNKTYSVTFYNLDMILAVGYRVRSNRAIMFRKWASKILTNYLVRGYAINSNVLTLSNQIHDIKSDVKTLKDKYVDIEKKVEAIEDSFFAEPIKEQLFFIGQEYEAYQFLWSVVQKAKYKVTIVDRYFDSSSLIIFKGLGKKIKKEVYLSNINNIEKKELDIFASEYGDIDLKINNMFHDRLILIDEEDCYSIGSSLNGMKKRIFLILKIETDEIIDSIKKLL